MKLDIIITGVSDEEANGRDHCFMQAGNSWASLIMALGQFRITRSLILGNRGVSLFLLGSKYFLPPISEWPDANGDDGGNNSNNQMWRWNMLTMLNVLLCVLILRIFLKLVWIGVLFSQAYLVCLSVGTFMVKPKEAGRRYLAIVNLTYLAFQLLWWCGGSYIFADFSISRTITQTFSSLVYSTWRQELSEL
jgi:hypothetical protein